MKNVFRQKLRPIGPPEKGAGLGLRIVNQTLWKEQNFTFYFSLVNMSLCLSL